MNPWWNLPFAILAALAVWCRAAAPQRAVDAMAGLLGFFGVDRSAPRQSAADFFGIAGIGGLLFVAWGGELAVMPALPGPWLLVDAVACALGLGLVGAWFLSRAGRPEEAASGAEADGETERISRQMTMIAVDELPRRTGGGPARGL
jgi:hypothetical protein